MAIRLIVSSVASRIVPSSILARSVPHTSPGEGKMYGGQISAV